METQSLIQVRIERPLKDEVSAIFESLGIDVSTAVRMFLQRCRAVKGIPFDLTVPEERQSRIKIGIAKGQWHFLKDWETQDRKLDREIEKDFYADTL